MTANTTPTAAELEAIIAKYTLPAAELEALIAKYEAIHITNPTLAELKAMIAKREAITTDQALNDALILGGVPDGVDQYDRLCNDNNDAIFAARPTEPAALALLLRYTLEQSLYSEIDEIDAAILEHIAEQLEALARAA